MPVVRPETRCARKPRSGPLQQVVGEARSAATDATAGPSVTPTFQPTSGRRSPRKFTPSGPQARACRGAASRGGRSRARSRPVGAMLQRQLDFTHRQARACGVDRHSRPRSRTRRRPGSRRGEQRRDSARWPDRGSRASKPARTSIRARATSFREPEASPSLLGERRDVEIGVAVEERRELSREVCIAEEERAGRGSALRCGQRLALSPTWAAAGRSHLRPRLRLPCRRASRRRPRSPRRRETSAAGSRRSSR